MKKIFIAVVFVLAMVTTGRAQNISITPKVLPTQGGSSRVGNFGLSWTVGETVQKSFKNGTLLLTQGFQQPDGYIAPECEGAIFSPLADHLTDCSRSSSDWIDNYRLQTSYIPNSNTPIKYYNINFVLPQRESPLAKDNFDETDATHLAYLQSIVDEMNNQLSSNAYPSDPQTAVCGSCYTADTRIRVVLKEIVPYRNNAQYSTFGLLDCNTLANRKQELNIVLTNNHDNSTNQGGNFSIIGFQNNCPDGSLYIAVTNVYSKYSNGTPARQPANLILHEIGHTWGLGHLYPNTDQPWWELCDNALIDYLADVFGVGPNANCWYDFNCPDRFDNVHYNCTNGFMGTPQAYPYGVYFSNYQLGRIHRDLATQFCRNYACGYGDTPFEVNTDQTWDFDIKFYQDIVVTSGHTLTITCKLNMVPGAKIIVEPGAKLFVDGGTITNAESSGCAGMWEGIIVQGDKTQEQDLSSTNNATATSTHQGFVFLKDATIENAHEALRVWNPADGWVSQNFWDNQGGTGGIVRAVNTHFLNNRRSAEFMWYMHAADYRLAPNKSFFYNCEFKTDDNHIADHPFSAHVTAWGVNAIRFMGCKFENAHTITSAMPDYELGTGINTIDAGIIVDDYNPSLSIGGNNLVRSQFINLQQGVAVANTNSSYAVTVQHAQFENCLRGIRNEGFGNCLLDGNDFTMGDNPAVITDPGAIVNYDEGIILRGDMAGFVVEQNTFTRTGSSNHQTYGVRADETGPNENRIYNNTYNTVTVGNLANRQNQRNDIVPAVGLKYECNSNTDNTWIDIGSFDDQSNQQAGVKEIQQGSFINTSAGNIFCQNTASPFSSSDFTDGTPTSITYYHHGSQIAGNFEYPLRRSGTVDPRNFTTINIATNECTLNYILPGDDDDPPGACSGCLSISGYGTAYSSYKTSALSHKSKYLALIDGGHTDTRMLQIDTTTNSVALKDTLLSYAPNLSTQVLDAVAHKYLLLSDTQQYLIFKANAEGLTEEVLEHWYENTDVYGWLRDSLEAARNNLTYRTFLLDTLLYNSEQKEQAVYSILRLIQQDTLGLDLASYRSWLDSTDAIWAKREKVNSYLMEGKLDTAIALLARYDTTIIHSVADSIRFKNYKDYALGYTIWVSVDSSIMRLDSAHLFALRAIAAGNEHRKGAQSARNVLNFFYDSAYFTPPILPDPGSGKRDENEPSQTSKISTSEKVKIRAVLKLYPNPAQNSINIEYSGVDEQSKLCVVDVLGLITESRLIGGEGKIEINTSSYQNGVYLARIENGTKALLKSKFIILK